MSRTPERTPDGPVTELAFWLALQRAPEMSGRYWSRLLSHPGAPRSLFYEKPQVLQSLGLKDPLVSYLRSPDWGAVEADLAWLDASPHRDCITRSDVRYPPLLREISSPPPVVFTVGDPATLLTHQIAVVGSRNPSPVGERTAREFAEALAVAGLTVTSGLAIGIDAAAHRGSLNAGGKTVAVVGTGLNQVYPRRHEALAEEISGSGAVVSEFPLGTPPRPGHFPRRNRIISGLSIGTLVVEASLRSGSLITAKAALDQGREVFAIPGSIHSAMARGCHSLIKQGAKLVESVDDVLEELGGFGLIPSRTGQPDPVGRTPDAAPGQLLKYVAWEPTSVDTLVRASGMNAETVSYLLLTLELEGYVASTPTGCYCRIA